MQTQITLLDYFEVEKSAWQVPLHEYLKLPESRELPKNTLLDTDLSQETPESLMWFTADQLELLCLYWGTARSGTKAEKIDRLLNAYNTYQTIARLGKAGLFKLTVPELKKMLVIICGNKGSWLNKRGIISKLLAEREINYYQFCYMLGELRHRQAVLGALRLARDVPEEVINSCPEYMIFYRKANGLPTEPEEMTGGEWAVFAPYVMKSPHTTNEDLEIERHWHIVRRAIEEGKKLKPEVLADHEERTKIRKLAIEAAIPRGPGWKLADLRTVKPGDMLFLTDGTQVKVLEAGDRVLAYNLRFDQKEYLVQGQTWHETPFRPGDKVRWKTESGKEKRGWIKHVRPRHDRVFGEEFFILTGRKFNVTDHPEYFTAPVEEVEVEN